MSESKWKPIQWGNCCAEAEVLTTLTEPNVAYDGDEARCLGCGRPGVVSADDDEAHINWHDETDCKCWWCQQADEIDKSHATIADLRRQVENYREDYKRIESRLKDAHDQLRCPDCKCADQIDAESSECGCDSPICARSDGKTLAESWLDLRRQLSEAQGVIEKLYHTADGVPVTPMMPLHNHRYHSPTTTTSERFAKWSSCDMIEIAECYSTREAALAAQEPRP